MDPMTIAAAAQLGAGLVQGVTGAIQKGKAKRMARANKRPVYEIQKPILDNQSLIESRAGQGLSDAALQTYRQSSERGLTSSIDAILAGGGSVNNIADLYSSFEGGISKMSLIDEEMRTRNVQNLITQNNALAGEQEKAWQINVYAPYADKAQAAAALSKQGTDNIWKGVNSVIGAGTNLATGNLYKKVIAAVYGTNGNLGNEPVPQAGSPGNELAFDPNIGKYNWQTDYGTIPKRPLSAAEKVQQQNAGLLLNDYQASEWQAGGYDMQLFGGPNN
jgi:hypothetical protein